MERIEEDLIWLVLLITKILEKNEYDLMWMEQHTVKID